ncbi:MAG: SDR family NAD(P)-dependent oxidoreductase [Acidimicrobiia bacterium]
MSTSTRPVALVTGASAGIGRAFALALADRGHDLVLVARDTARLDALAKEIGDAYGASAEVLTADLSDPSALALVEARVAEEARPIALLVNNAGFGTSGKFASLPIEREVQEIQLNVIALVRLTHAALEAQTRRGSGGVINLASIAGYQPTPGNATYGATKAFVSSFTQAVHEELRGTGVKCMVLSPGFTRTEFQERAGFDSSEVPGFLWQDAPTVVQHALRAYDKGRAVCVPGPLNSATAALTAVTPHSVTRRIAGVVVSRSEK